MIGERTRGVEGPVRLGIGKKEAIFLARFADKYTIWAACGLAFCYIFGFFYLGSKE